MIRHSLQPAASAVSRSPNTIAVRSGVSRARSRIQGARVSTRGTLPRWRRSAPWSRGARGSAVRAHPGHRAGHGRRAAEEARRRHARAGAALPRVPGQDAAVAARGRPGEAADLGETDIYLHTIPTNETHKVYHRPRKYSRRQLRFIREEVQKLLKAGVIQKSKSPWGFPPVIVDKKNGSQRLCIDYRKLNDVTIRDSYPLPNIAETLDSFHGAKYFSTLDLTSGYWQMKIHPKDRAKTAFNTRHGHFEFVRMPFGLTNAPASFQRLMDRVLEQEIGDFVQVYLDDIIIYSETWEEHLIHLNKVLERLEKAGLKLSKEKCKFGETELEFLGHIISRDGIKPDPNKIEKIKNWPTPEGPKKSQES